MRIWFANFSMTSAIGNSSKPRAAPAPTRALMCAPGKISRQTKSSTMRPTLTRSVHPQRRINAFGSSNAKREKSIPPRKLLKYLAELPTDQSPRIDGLIFAAATDFSKRARDEFRAKIADLGIQEAYLWGKAEIEDMLFSAQKRSLAVCLLRHLNPNTPPVAPHYHSRSPCHEAQSQTDH